jgi:hypothetical protein
MAQCPAKNDRFQNNFSPLPRIAAVFRSTKKADILFRRNDISAIQTYNQLHKMNNYLLLMLFRVVVKEPHPSLEAVQAEGLKLLDDMSGHPSMARYREEGFDVITF